MLQSGTLIAGRYEIESPLASGGSGLVYSATDRTTEKRVAIKVLGPHLLHARAAREKLRLEAIVAGRVESEHIVQVSDAGIDIATGLPFLVMELLKGQNLQEHVEQRGPLEPTLALEYLRQVASGLDKAHNWKDRDSRAAPIVHRDLKPENLFLSYREDGSPVVKILDFGLAKVLSVSATLSSEVKGTPLYMAPEQLSQAQVTPATDIWALGLVAFFFLSAKCYWLTGQDERAILPAVLREVVDGVRCPASLRLQRLCAGVELPPAFDAWFATCLDIDPGLRFKSAGQAIRALAAALDQPLVSSPVATTGPTAASSGRLSVAPPAGAAASSQRRLAASSSPLTSSNIDAEAPVGKGPVWQAARFGWVVAALVGVVAAWLVSSMMRERSVPQSGATPSNALVAAPEATTAGTATVLPAATALHAPQQQTVAATQASALPSIGKKPSDASANPSASARTPSRAAARATARPIASSAVPATKATSGAESPREGPVIPAPPPPRAPLDPADHR